MNDGRTAAGVDFRAGVPDDFEAPTQLPASRQQKERWQKANRSWWEKHPMRYDWSGHRSVGDFSPSLYEEIDRDFFSDVARYLPFASLPFDSLIPYAALPGLDVLEVGVGMGSVAALLSRHAGSFVGIDITDYATRSTADRFRRSGLGGAVVRMDAEDMAFPDASFDFVWSWGVLHHTADTKRALEEVARVLRPGGRAITMVYHRSWWNYYVVTGMVRGLLQRERRSIPSISGILQAHTDGALARYYSIQEWRRLVEPLLDVESVSICGSKAEVCPIPRGRAKRWIIDNLPDGASRTITNRLRAGTFLVSELRKR